MDEVKVEQVDRDAAAEVFKALLPASDCRAANAIVGNMDDSAVVQAFARHRIAPQPVPAKPHCPTCGATSREDWSICSDAFHALASQPVPASSGLVER